MHRFRKTSFIALILFLLSAPTFALAEISDQECMSCHGDAAKVKAIINPEDLGNSVHKDLSCTECHESIKSSAHEQKLPKVHCGSCHEDEESAFKGSIHGIADVKVKDEDIKPSCVACHGAHNVLRSKNSNSKTNSKNISQTCAHCHSDQRILSQVSRRSINPVTGYEHSVHNQPAKDNPKKLAATCIDCHSAHEIFGPANPKSSINKFNVPKTCGKCHEKENQEYNLSVHWQSVSVFGHYEAPVCNDCHGEHQPMLSSQRDSSVHPTLASSQLCANCHSNRVLMARFGLDARRFESYMKTYHGLAALRGSPNAANCVSCHEVHAIRGQADTLSSVNRKNLANTCSKCHVNANSGFVGVAVHPLNQHDRNPIAYFFKMFYISFILISVAGMLLHNAIILCHHLRLKWQEKKSQPQVTRFTTFQIVQHFILFLSFSTLAITGFALKFTDAWWVSILSYWGMNEAARSLVHRGAAVVLVIISIVQLVYFIGAKGGRRDAISLVPRWPDVAGFWYTMRFYILGDVEPPKAGRYDYAEKAEYLALIWGIVVMAATGFVLWFPEFFMQYLPVWSFEVSEVIHFFEALLAVLAIFVWHLFFTILHPDKYPMSTTWIDGKVTQDEQKHHHSLE